MWHPTSHLKFVRGKLYQLWADEGGKNTEWRVVETDNMF